MCRNILLASHGSIGARQAEQVALKFSAPTAHVTHLHVIPEFWQHILGDDWLNNVCTQRQFVDYLENQLEQEAHQNCMRVREDFENHNVNYAQKILFGQPQKCLLDTYSQDNFDLVVMGSTRPKKMHGLKSKMLSKAITNTLARTLMVVPHPNA